MPLNQAIPLKANPLADTSFVPAKTIGAINNPDSKLTSLNLVANSETLSVSLTNNAQPGGDDWYLNGVSTRNPIQGSTSTEKDIITNRITLSYNMGSNGGTPGSTTGGYLEFYIGSALIYSVDLTRASWSTALDGNIDLTLPEAIFIPKDTILKIKAEAVSWSGNYHIYLIARLNIVGVSIS